MTDRFVVPEIDDSYPPNFREIKAPMGWEREVLIRSHALVLLGDLVSFFSTMDAEDRLLQKEMLLDSVRGKLSMYLGDSPETSSGSVADAFSLLIHHGVMPTLPQVTDEEGDCIEKGGILHIRSGRLEIQISADLSLLQSTLTQIQKEQTYCQMMYSKELQLEASLQSVPRR